MPTPALGRHVLYRLSADDADRINRYRADYTSSAKNTRTGFIGHVGNQAAEGVVCPALIVRVWDEPEPTCNLQVFLDGTDTYWATSRKEGTDVAQWMWPEVK